MQTNYNRMSCMFGLTRERVIIPLVRLIRSIIKRNYLAAAIKRLIIIAARNLYSMLKAETNQRLKGTAGGQRDQRLGSERFCDFLILFLLKKLFHR